MILQVFRKDLRKTRPKKGSIDTTNIKTHDFLSVPGMWFRFSLQRRRINKVVSVIQGTLYRPGLADMPRPSVSPAFRASTRDVSIQPHHAVASAATSTSALFQSGARSQNPSSINIDVDRTERERLLEQFDRTRPSLLYAARRASWSDPLTAQDVVFDDPVTAKRRTFSADWMNESRLGALFERRAGSFLNAFDLEPEHRWRLKQIYVERLKRSAVFLMS